MRKNKRKLMVWVLILSFLFPFSVWAAQEEPAASEGEMIQREGEVPSIGIEAPHAILMEASTGTILYEKDAHRAVPPASVTKIMTMLLIFEALEDNKIKLEDTVVVSEKAASMGGSQVFLEPNEKQTVDTMLKCIAVASANDACVAMAEFVSGSEEAFVNKMNERAKELGMENTHFVNCNGLDAEGHVTSAYDIALMSRELLINHPQVHDYCTIWMDTIIHNTAKGSQEFGLNNTNKLVRQYEYCTGLKTGSTSDAGFCVSATAKKGDMELIAVILNGETSKSRFLDATTLLNYGYANYQIYRDSDAQRDALSEIPVRAGVETSVLPVYEKEFAYLLMNGEGLSDIEKKMEIMEEVEAPVEEGQVLGTLAYYSGSKKLGEIGILASKAIEAAKYADYVKRVWLAWMM